MEEHRTIKDNPDITNAVSHATCTTAVDLQAAAIITVTKSGRTVGMVSKYRLRVMPSPVTRTRPATWTLMRLVVPVIPTVGMVSKYRPGCTIIGCCMDDYVCRQLNLSWGMAIRTMVFKASTGYWPEAVSPESIMALVPW